MARVLFCSGAAGLLQRDGRSTVSCTCRQRTTMTADAIKRHPDGGVTSPKGFRGGATSAAFKPSGAVDLAVIVSDQSASAAGTFTTNVVCAAPVVVCKEHLEATGNRSRAIVINSGQANAATGNEGLANSRTTAQIAARTLGIDPTEVLVASTGVIGQQIDMSKMEASLPALIENASAAQGSEVSQAILTTDLAKKACAYEVQLSSGVVTLGGISKGSGMIHPDMATMLGFVTTDAKVDAAHWAAMVRHASARSFNQITVDGDTSTNDCLLALANGASGVAVDSDEDQKLFSSALTECCQHLAKAIARDGEGSSVLLEVQVNGAPNDEDAGLIARTIVGSSLVKSAVFGRDPNWGRIAAAAGRAGVRFDQERLDVRLGDQQMLLNGQPLQFDRKAASEYMRKASESSSYLSEEDTVRLTVRVGDGDGQALAWGCDLSYDYVRINAEYTT